MGNELDALIADYERLFESTNEVGGAVCYDHDTWDAIREAFTKIIAAVRNKGDE